MSKNKKNLKPPPSISKNETSGKHLVVESRFLTIFPTQPALKASSLQIVSFVETKEHNLLLGRYQLICNTDGIQGYHPQSISIASLMTKWRFVQN